MKRVSTLMVLVSPTRSNSPSCKHAQELDLELGRRAIDLVEEDAAGVGGLEAAGAVFIGACERALDVAEQLAFEQAFGQGPAVDADVGAALAGAQVVDGAGDEFLAAAGLADDQHARAAGGHAPGDAGDFANAGADADHAGQGIDAPGTLASRRAWGAWEFDHQGAWT